MSFRGRGCAVRVWDKTSVECVVDSGQEATGNFLLLTVSSATDAPSALWDIAANQVLTGELREAVQAAPQITRVSCTAEGCNDTGAGFQVTLRVSGAAKRLRFSSVTGESHV